MKYITVQIGARRGYAVPALLERAGMLEHFYTDICADHGLGRVLAAIGKLTGAGYLGRLRSRRLPPEILSKATAFAGASLYYGLRKSLSCGDVAEQFRHHVRWNQALGRAVLKRGFGQATHVFSMLGEFDSLLLSAKAAGIGVVSEIYICLSAARIRREEQALFPGWEAPDFGHEEILGEFYPEPVLLGSSDYAICPSEWVQSDLVQNFNFPIERTRIVPYGCHPRWLRLDSMPQKGRILFVGTAELRKGIHYFAMAAEQLQGRGRSYEFRVAGNVADSTRQQPVCRHLTFLGRVSRESIHEEFQKADVFALPSLAEGSAEVTYEALAMGVPLVVTKAAGSVVRDGMEGRIVRERDPDALATAIELLVEDRAQRNQMAAAARERAREYTWERYGERLVSALQTIGVAK